MGPVQAKLYDELSTKFTLKTDRSQVAKMISTLTLTLTLTLAPHPRPSP